MKKRSHIFIALAVITFVGAWFAMLASNMLGSDLGNKAVGFSNMTILVSLPAVFVALTFVVTLLYIIRMQRHPDCKKRLTRLYSIYYVVFGALGAIFAIVGSLVCYGTLVGPNPFPGYSIIFLILNLLVAGAGAYGLFVCLKKLPEDQGKIKVGVVYVLKTIGWFLFVSLILNRLGMFVSFPLYFYARNFYKTFPFYLYLLLPVFLGVVEVLHIYKVGERKTINLLTYIGLGLNVIFFTYIVIMGSTDTGFISSVSQAMPLERLASKPLEILIHFVAYNGVIAVLLVQNRKAK